MLDEKTCITDGVIPYRWYYDPEIFERELKLIFSREWQYVGHTGQLTGAGSFITGKLGRLPVVVVRDRSGNLNAFANVCRHRGAVIMQGSGTCQFLYCDYHGWSYSLDGELRGAAQSSDDPTFDKSKYPLTRLAVDTWGPLVFVNPDRECAKPLREWLGPIPDLLVEHGIELDALMQAVEFEAFAETNWKLYNDNTAECYHCPTTHRGLDRLHELDPKIFTRRWSGGCSLVLLPVARHVIDGSDTHPKDCYDAAGPITMGQFNVVWPNLQMQVTPGRPNFGVVSIEPLGPSRCRLFGHNFFLPDEDPTWIKDVLKYYERIGDEDTRILERVQVGVTSGVYERAAKLLPNEFLVGNLNQLTYARLTGVDLMPEDQVAGGAIITK